MHGAPALAVTTRAIKSNIPIEVDMEEENKNPFGDVP